ncbi:MAG: hypothetical protein GY875_14910 [Gammaproteobacteria bacterium]|nr:hypothetical protein [Gammaproteobacteria bacterium]
MDTRVSRKSTLIIARLVSVLMFAAVIVSGMLPGISVAQEASSANQSTRHSSIYYPNTETLSPDEMRITALGTGLPTPITRAQKSTARSGEAKMSDYVMGGVWEGFTPPPLPKE